jgi:predicted Rossmann-fold nucleotide-binding protein
MTPDQFWTGLDGQILLVRPGEEAIASLTLVFWPKNPAEFEFLKAHLQELHFTERSTLARIGLDITLQGPPVVDGNRLIVEATAFLYDETFPNSAYWKKLLRSGVPVGRLFYAPESAKLTAEEIWSAVQANQLKLPNTISIDRAGRVFLTPHRVRYTLSPKLQRPEFERLVNGSASRTYLDKVQLRHDTDLLIIPPRSGVLTSCSMYLKEHYVLLNRGEGNFGIHTSAVLLDPVKTFGTNIMLEIYNTGDEPVVNPVVSVEIFRAPVPADPDTKTHHRRRTRLLASAVELYRCLDEAPPRETAGAKPRARLTVKGQSSTMENYSLFMNAGDFGTLKSKIEQKESTCGYRTMVEAMDAAPEHADTLLINYFPNLLEEIELLTRLQQLKLKRIIFRKPSRTHGFFLSNNAHARLDTFEALDLDVYWYNESMNDLYLHTYKKDHGFFIREEMAKKFQETTILAFYGSAVGLEQADTDRISTLIDRLTAFIGPSVGVLTGGGPGVMRLATDQARNKGALTGACFLELEAQPPELGVDFFQTFQETARHSRQKWFEIADFCIFNVGGVGTLEEIGIELCNLKLGIRPRIPYIFYNASFWGDLQKQIEEMVHSKRVPAWITDYILFTNDPDEVVAFYRRTLQVM